ncbi:Hypothetical protein PHPALM_9595 [Phytophthora palmivora]|uniref:Uncharacterized protein n=1 Tax=Phytophthora palmivora TaxID=4796 RepID=A0A2P4Y6W0_9STRA|nr:Hypothetical protein PHPALM_9595 [Phytophthora palmivora]
MQHIRREHPSFTEEMLAATPGETGSLAPYVRHSTKNLFGWLQWVVKCNLPISFCKTPLVNDETADFSAASHQAFLASMLARDYQKNLEQCIFLFGNNCSSKTNLRPIMRQQTRWSSTFAMLKRFYDLLPFIDAEDEELAELLPPVASKRRLRDLLAEHALQPYTLEMLLFLRQNADYWDARTVESAA